MPKDEIEATENVALLMTYGGGHISHLQGFNPFGKTYFEDIMEDYIENMLMHSHHFLEENNDRPTVKRVECVAECT